jgi:hypothetical protein
MEKYKQKYKYYDLVKEDQVSYLNEMFESFLQEKTFKITKDVDYIYNMFFKNIIFDFKKKNIMPKIGEYGRILSSELTSQDCVNANKVFPVTIICGVFTEGSYYSPKDSEIFISINKDAVKYFNDKDTMTKNMRRAIENEITEYRSELPLPEGRSFSA